MMLCYTKTSHICCPRPTSLSCAGKQPMLSNVATLVCHCTAVLLGFEVASVTRLGCNDGRSVYWSHGILTQSVDVCANETTNVVFVSSLTLTQQH